MVLRNWKLCCSSLHNLVSVQWTEQVESTVWSERYWLKVTVRILIQTCAVPHHLITVNLINRVTNANWAQANSEKRPVTITRIRQLRTRLAIVLLPTMLSRTDSHVKTLSVVYSLCKLGLEILYKWHSAENIIILLKPL